MKICLTVGKILLVLSLNGSEKAYFLLLHYYLFVFFDFAVKKRTLVQITQASMQFLKIKNTTKNNHFA